MSCVPFSTSLFHKLFQARPLFQAQ
jgi:hypothetical protein